MFLLIVSSSRILLHYYAKFHLLWKHISFYKVYWKVSIRFPRWIKNVNMFGIRWTFCLTLVLSKKFFSFWHCILLGMLRVWSSPTRLLTLIIRQVKSMLLFAWFELNVLFLQESTREVTTVASGESGCVRQLTDQ